MKFPDLLMRTRAADMDLLRHLAFTLAGCGRRAEALRHAARACELRPHDARTWSDQGCIHAMCGDLTCAISRYSVAVGVDRGFAAGWHNLGVALARVGAAGAACRALRSALELDASSAKTWFALGALLLDAGLPERALPTLERAERLAGGAGVSFTISELPRVSGDCPCVSPPSES